MKANEFVRDKGIEKAKEVIDKHSETVAPKVFKYFSPSLNDYHMMNLPSTILIDDLKRLVESWELVESYKSRFGDDAEWFFISEYCKKNRISPFFSENYNKASSVYKQAIKMWRVVHESI